MLGFALWISGVGSVRSTNRVTTIAPSQHVLHQWLKSWYKEIAWRNIDKEQKSTVSNLARFKRNSQNFEAQTRLKLDWKNLGSTRAQKIAARSSSSCGCQHSWPNNQPTMTILFEMQKAIIFDKRLQTIEQNIPLLRVSLARHLRNIDKQLRTSQRLQGGSPRPGVWDLEKQRLPKLLLTIFPLITFGYV